MRQLKMMKLWYRHLHSTRSFKVILKEKENKLVDVKGVVGVVRAKGLLILHRNHYQAMTCITVWLGLLENIFNHIMIFFIHPEHLIEAGKQCL